MIRFNEEKKIFKLDTASSSYIFGVDSRGVLVHYYYGVPLMEDCVEHLAARHIVISLEYVPQEYSVYGVSDYRPEALRIRNRVGNAATFITYDSHKIYKGKKSIPGLPSTFGKDDEVETLEILCRDKLTGAEVTLTYSVFEKMSVMTRRTSIKNTSNSPLVIERADSACLDLHTNDYDMIHLPGRWGKERNFTRTPLEPLTKRIASARGSSSHMQNPFCALVSKNADETKGEVYAFNLVYSGNFAIDVDVDSVEATRVNIGINPENFQWKLESGESFDTPEAVMLYTDAGLGEMSRILHRFYRRHLIHGEWANKKRPLLINNWEATYFNFDEEKLLNIASAAKELGIEMLVLDDGWFGHRANDKSSLGDWYVFEEKLPAGLSSLSDKLHAMGMLFGLWFEPEMVSPDSDLYRAHPDWCLHIDGRDRTLRRNQLVLDFSRPEVVDFIYDSMCKILDSTRIDYIKWDYNRYHTEVGSCSLPPERQKEVEHRYMLGLYGLLEKLTARYPHILFEGCAGGGGRFDPGMLYYTPQIWASDDSDAIERLNIQYGTSMCYPASTVGAHVSAVPNHQVSRITPLTTRGNVALAGTFGYELDATRFTDAERETVKKQVAEYHKYYDVIHYGDLYRLVSPEGGETAAWEYVAEDKSEALVTIVVIRARARRRRMVRLQGLDPMRHYRDEESGRVMLGSTWMAAGLNYPNLYREYDSVKLHLVAID